MLSCHQATRLASESLERPLLFKEKMALRFHTMICAGCRNFEKSVHTIHHAMGEFASGKHEPQKDKDNQ